MRLKNASKCNLMQLVQLLREKMGSCILRDRGVDLSVPCFCFKITESRNCQLHTTEASRVRRANRAASLGASTMPNRPVRDL